MLKKPRNITVHDIKVVNYDNLIYSTAEKPVEEEI
jgi:hypothetical protein